MLSNNKAHMAPSNNTLIGSLTYQGRIVMTSHDALFITSIIAAIEKQIFAARNSSTCSNASPTGTASPTTQPTTSQAISCPKLRYSQLPNGKGSADVNYCQGRGSGVEASGLGFSKITILRFIGDGWDFPADCVRVGPAHREGTDRSTSNASLYLSLERGAPSGT